MKVGNSSFRYFSAAIVSLLLMMTLPSSSSSAALCDHSSQLANPLPSPTALPSAKPAGSPAFCRLAPEAEEAGRTPRPFWEPARLQHQFAVHQGPAAGAERQPDPGIAL